jgi:hypothetical protein
MVGGILAGYFRRCCFHSEMSNLLILLMSTNLVAGLLIMPALIADARNFLPGTKGTMSAPRAGERRVPLRRPDRLNLR